MSIRQFSKSLAFRIILTLVAAFLGTTGGIYFTQSWQEPRSKTEISDRSIEYPGSYLAFGAGDQFPAEKYKDREGNTGEFTDLLRGKKTVVLFVSLDCEPCANLVRAWRNDMSHRLLPGVQSLICLALPAEIPDKYKSLCDSLRIVFFDYNRWLTAYSLSEFPTLIGVDEQNTVTDVQFGYVGRIDYELESGYLKPSL